MTATVYRYPLAVTDRQVISMPEGATILKVARRDGHTVVLGVGAHEAVELWALVDPDAPMRERVIRAAGTGHPMPDAAELTYLDTVQVRNGQLVFHFFESSEPAGEQPRSLADRRAG